MHLCIFLCGFFQAMIFSLNPSTTCCLCILLRSYLTSDHQYMYVAVGQESELVGSSRSQHAQSSVSTHRRHRTEFISISGLDVESNSILGPSPTRNK